MPKLRAQVADRLTRDGCSCTADDVLIIQGGQQGLDLAAKLMVNAGDVIVTENPTFLGALIAFAPTEPRYAAVRTDADGMDTDHLEEVLAGHPDAKMIYTVPDFQNPTGITMSLDRRRRLIELANAYGLLVVEDTPYRALRYEGTSLPTLKSLDTEGRVYTWAASPRSWRRGCGWAGRLPARRSSSDSLCSSSPRTRRTAPLTWPPRRTTSAATTSMPTSRARSRSTVTSAT